MRLAELFRNTSQVNTNTAVSQGTSAQATGQTQGVSQAQAANAAVRQILSSLSPGDTIQGEIVSSDSGTIQIRLSNNALVDAKLDGSVSGQSALSLGKLLNFEVRGNGQSLTLSPLYTNMTSEGTASKALNMANLPVTTETMTMTTKLMEAGQSVDTDSLSQVYREVTDHMDADLMDIIDLHKFGMEVTDENLTQIASYRNLTHQLTGGMTEILNQLPGTLQELMQSGNTEGAANIAQTLLNVVLENAATMVDGELANTVVPDGEMQGMEQQASVVPEDPVLNTQTAAQENPGGINANAQPATAQIQNSAADMLLKLLAQASGEQMGGQASEVGMESNAAANTAAAGMESNAAANTASAGGAQTAAADVEQLWNSLYESLQSLTEGDGDYTNLLNSLKQNLTSGQMDAAAQNLQELLSKAQADGNHPEILQKILQNKTLSKVLEKALTQQWTLTPEDVSDPEKVDKLYQRLDSQLKTILHTLEQNGQGESQMAQSTQNMSNNLDFLQQLNMTYTYVQLPLRFQEGNAHGDLYVYTNKRNLAAKDGPVSALLHLDMEHLGPVDVYVTLDNRKVNTNFRVQDDESLDFLEAHMDLLTSRLQKRGYDCGVTMQVRGADEPAKSGLGGLEEKETSRIIAQYSFDVRA